MNEDYFTFDLVPQDGKVRLVVDEWYKRADGYPGYSCEMFLLTIDELQTLYELIGGYLVRNTNLLDQEAG